MSYIVSEGYKALRKAGAIEQSAKAAAGEIPVGQYLVSTVVFGCRDSPSLVGSRRHRACHDPLQTRKILFQNQVRTSSWI